MRPRTEATGAVEAVPDPVLEPSAADRISTDQQREMQAAIARAKSAAGDARAARLAEIEAEVRKGNYRPDPARIAQRIMDEAELLATIHAILRR